MSYYEKEQERLHKLMEECFLEEEEERPDQEISDDDDSTNELDNVEERSDSDTEQEVESEDDDLESSIETISTDSQFREPVYKGKDGTEWKLFPPNKRVRTSQGNILKQLPGPKNCTRGIKKAIDIWNFFFNDDMLQLIVDNTNVYIHSMTESYSRTRDARLTSLDEIRAFLGLLYIAGTYKANHVNLEDLWSNNGQGIEIFRLTMSIKRFLFLKRCIRFDNKNDREERRTQDKLAAIRVFFEMFVYNCKNGYSLSEFVTIDEKLEAFRGHCPFRQYIPSKPNKYGIKIFALSDATMYYTSNLEVYVGRQPEGPFFINTSASSVVERLIQPISKSGRNVTLDNWFMSIPLVDKLQKDHNLTAVGTLRKNKRELPAILIQGNRPVNSSIFAFREKCTVTSYAPKKNKVVLLASSMHNDDAIDPESGEAYKPEILTTYNRTRGGVDMVDKLCETYNCARITRRWPMVIFYSCLNVAGINTQVIYNANNSHDKPIRRRKFLRELGFALLQDHLHKRAAIPNLPRTLSLRIKELCGLREQQPTNTTFPDKGRCSYCDRKKNRPTKYFCKNCHKFMCLEHATFVCNECLKTV